MLLSEHYLADDLHPIDVVENLAERREWEFDRVGDDQIAMEVEGQWRVYSITLAWSDCDETLRLICAFEMEPPDNRLPVVYETLNRANDLCWEGAFTFWPEQGLMAYRYGLVLAGGHTAGTEQVDRIIAAAVLASERFYPAFQLVAWAERSPKDAMQIAIAETYGTA